MPKDLVANVIENYKFNGDEMVKHLASEFNVSDQAMSFRLSNLGYYIG